MDFTEKELIPGFYVSTDSPTPVTYSDELLKNLLNDIESYPIDPWSDMAQLRKEFKIDEIFGDSMVYNIDDPRLIKGFFAYRGTPFDLRYIFKAVGLDIDIVDHYNLVMQGFSQRVFNTPEIYKFKKKYPKYRSQKAGENIKECEIEAQIQIMLDSELFTGVNATAYAKIKEILKKRINACARIIGTSLYIKDNTDFYDFAINESAEQTDKLSTTDHYDYPLDEEFDISQEIAFVDECGRRYSTPHPVKFKKPYPKMRQCRSEEMSGEIWIELEDNYNAPMSDEILVSQDVFFDDGSSGRKFGLNPPFTHNTKYSRPLVGTDTINTQEIY